MLAYAHHILCILTGISINIALAACPLLIGLSLLPPLLNTFDSRILKQKRVDLPIFWSQKPFVDSTNRDMVWSSMSSPWNKVNIPTCFVHTTL